MKLSPFSPRGEAKIWYDLTAWRVGGDWTKLKEEFCFSATKVFAFGIEWEKSLLTAKSGTPHHISEDAKATPRWFSEPLFPLKPTDHPISCILSPPPHIVEITEPIKSTDHEPLVDDMSMLIMTSVMFQTCRRSISAYAQDLRHSFQMLHHRLRVLL